MSLEKWTENATLGFSYASEMRTAVRAQVASRHVITLHINMEEGGIDGGDACKCYKNSTTSLHVEVADPLQIQLKRGRTWFRFGASWKSRDAPLRCSFASVSPLLS